MPMKRTRNRGQSVAWGVRSRSEERGGEMGQRISRRRRRASRGMGRIGSYSTLDSLLWLTSSFTSLCTALVLSPIAQHAFAPTPAAFHVKPTFIGASLVATSSPITAIVKMKVGGQQNDDSKIRIINPLSTPVSCFVNGSSIHHFSVPLHPSIWRALSS